MKTSTVVPLDGSLLRERRKRAGLSQRDLAALLGVTKQAVSLIELGRRQPRLMTLARLAAVLK